MVEDIRDLIEKINRDGIRAAEEKARDIEDAARRRADDIIAAAQHEAEDLISAAKERIRREDEKERTLLVQAGRDMLLSLREEINAMLGRILVTDIRKTLTPEALSMILAEAIRKYGSEESGDIIIFLSPKDRENLEQNFLARLREETGKKVVIRPSGDISHGFSLSFDSGKSCYDFSDKALAEYIGTYLKPRLNGILREPPKD
jgi:vacuolar-type H+-ATPase subunit E/Vma4